MTSPPVPFEEAIAACEAELRALAEAASNPESRQAFLLQLAFARPYHTWAMDAEHAISADNYLCVVGHALAAIAAQAVGQLEGPQRTAAAEITSAFAFFLKSHLGQKIAVAEVRRHNA